MGTYKLARISKQALNNMTEEERQRFNSKAIILQKANDVISHYSKNSKHKKSKSPQTKNLQRESPQTKNLHREYPQTKNLQRERKQIRRINGGGFKESLVRNRERQQFNN